MRTISREEVPAGHIMNHTYTFCYVSLMVTPCCSSCQYWESIWHWYL